MKNVNYLKRTEVSHLSLFCGLFILSCLGGVFVGKNAILESGVLERDSLNLLRLPNINNVELFFYIFRERCLILPVLFLVSTTYLGKGAGYVSCAWYGIGIGSIVGTALLRYGFGGIILILGSAFPQYLLYVPAYILSIRITGVQRRAEKKLFIQLLLVEGMVIAGCMTECHLNPIIMEKLLFVLMG